MTDLKLGKEWKWPSPLDLDEWEAKIRARHTRSISPGNQLMLIRAVRSQRKVIEKLAKLLALPGAAPDEVKRAHRVESDSLDPGSVDEVAGDGSYHLEMLDDNACLIDLGPDRFTLFWDRKRKAIVVRREML